MTRFVINIPMSDIVTSGGRRVGQDGGCVKTLIVDDQRSGRRVLKQILAAAPGHRDS